MIVLLILSVLFMGGQSLSPASSGPYAMVPDSTGNMHVITVAEANTATSESDSFFNPATDIIFLLFTRTNPETAHRLMLNDSSTLSESHFDPSHPTRLLIHGWTGHGGSRMNLAIRDAFLHIGDFNVIVVDWGAGAQTANYMTARNRVGPTGFQVADLIIFMAAEAELNPQQVTLIGYSLGAHVAGFAGKALTGDLRLGNIVALDAAAPLFDYNRPADRLHVGDALYVESIHTNGRLLGFWEPLGHANFYPNFGRRQPGCGVDVGGGCAHGRAHEFYAESLTSSVGFWARECRGLDDIASRRCRRSGADHRMGGEPTDTGARGIYWLPTENRAPFAMGLA